MSQAKSLNVAIIGGDSTHVDAFIPHLIESGNRISSVFDKNLDVAQAVCKRLRVDQSLATDNLASTLNNANFAMVVGRFADSHFEPALECVRSGIPTFVDKPFTDDAEDARALSDAALQFDVPLFTCSPLRFCSEVRQVHHALELEAEDTQIQAISVFAPANCIDIGSDSRFESHLFYGIHGADICSYLANDSMNLKSTYRGSTSSILSFESESGLSLDLILVRDTREAYSVVTHYANGGQVMQNIALDGSYYNNMLIWLLTNFMSEPQSSRYFDSMVTVIEALNILDRK